jgi:hypothetical protein
MSTGVLAGRAPRAALRALEVRPRCLDSFQRSNSEGARARGAGVVRRSLVRVVMGRGISALAMSADALARCDV